MKIIENSTSLKNQQVKSMALKNQQHTIQQTNKHNLPAMNHPAILCPTKVHIRKHQRKVNNNWTMGKKSNFPPKSTWAPHLHNVFVGQVVKVRFNIQGDVLADFEGSIINIYPISGYLKIHFAYDDQTWDIPRFGLNAQRIRLLE